MCTGIVLVEGDTQQQSVPESQSVSNMQTQFVQLEQVDKRQVPDVGRP